MTLLKHEPMFVYHMPDSMIELQSTFERLFHEEKTYVNITDILNGTAEELIPPKHKDLTCAHLLSVDASSPRRRRVQSQRRRGGSVSVGPRLDTSELGWGGDSQQVRGRGREDAHRICVEWHGENGPTPTL